MFRERPVSAAQPRRRRAPGRGINLKKVQRDIYATQEAVSRSRDSNESPALERAGLLFPNHIVEERLVEVLEVDEPISATAYEMLYSSGFLGIV